MGRSSRDRRWASSVGDGAWAIEMNWPSSGRARLGPGRALLPRRGGSSGRWRTAGDEAVDHGELEIGLVKNKGLVGGCRTFKACSHLKARRYAWTPTGMLAAETTGENSPPGLAPVHCTKPGVMSSGACVRRPLALELAGDGESVKGRQQHDLDPAVAGNHVVERPERLGVVIGVAGLDDPSAPQDVVD